MWEPSSVSFFFFFLWNLANLLGREWWYLVDMVGGGVGERTDESLTKGCSDLWFWWYLRDEKCSIQRKCNCVRT